MRRMKSYSTPTSRCGFRRASFVQKRSITDRTHQRHGLSVYFERLPVVSLLGESLRVVAQVIVDEALDKPVAVVVVRLHAQIQRLTGGRTR